MANTILDEYGRLRSEIFAIIDDLKPREDQSKRRVMTNLIRDLFLGRMWANRVDVFDDSQTSGGKVSYMKGRVAVQVSFNHYLRIGTELLRFQTLSFADQNHIDVGVYICITNALLHKWSEGFFGSITFEKATSYYESYKNMISVPVLFIGLLPDNM